MKYFLPLYLFLLCACGKDPAIIDSLPLSDTTQKLTTNYLALGDSYTIGEGVLYELNYPNQLFTKLVADEIPMDSLTIIAQTGWTTEELAAGIEQANPDSNYCLVSLSIGVNNQFREYAIAAYEVNFEKLLQQAIAFAGGNKNGVFVISIPDYGFSPFGQRRDRAKISRELDEYNAINKRISETYEVKYFDITPISREGLDRPELIAADDLHPSAKQYEEWISFMYEQIKQEMLPK